MGANAIDGTKMSNTKSYSAGTTMTVSGSPAVGQYFGVYITNTNAGGGAAIVCPITGMTPSQVTVPTNSTNYYLLRTTGAGAYMLVGGLSCDIDLAAATTPASTDLIGVTGSSTGTKSKSTLAQVVSAGFPAAIPNGTTATTQSALSNDTKVATDAYVDSAVAAGGSSSFTYPGEYSYAGCFANATTLSSVNGFSAGAVGTLTAIAPTATSHGYMEYTTTAATTGLQAGIQESTTICTFGNKPIFIAKGALPAYTVGSVRFAAGLSGGSLLGLDLPNATNMAYFRYSTSASDTYFMAVTGNSSGGAAVSTGVAADAGEHTFKIVIGASNVKFYIDGNLTNTISSNLPAASDIARCNFTLQTLANTANAVEVAQVVCIKP